METCIGRVFDIQRFSIHDGPGIRSTIFLKGCPMQCIWCANLESQKLNQEIMWYSERCIHCVECINICSREVISWNENYQDSNRNINALCLDFEQCNGCGECVKVCPSGALRLIGEKYSVRE